MAGAGDLHAAVVEVWNSSVLNDQFTVYWPQSAAQEFVVLHDMEAEPKQPFPYCVFQQQPGSTIARMSGPVAGEKVFGYEIRQVPWQFTIQSRAANGKSGKQVAVELASAIMGVFGGHPTIAPATPYTMDNGGVLLAQYQNDYGARTELEDWSWVVAYLFTLDVPVVLDVIS